MDEEGGAFRDEQGRLCCRVRRQDSLTSISIRHAVSVSKLKRLNKLWTEGDMHALQTLVLSEAGGKEPSRSAGKGKEEEHEEAHEEQREGQRAPLSPQGAARASLFDARAPSLRESAKKKLEDTEMRLFVL